ncbi:MAG TPA: hypothetical protein VN375_10370 [Vicinamibacteria bacterium]|jgi:hypothetical protein|nr:hypothetical protein [Vicinamibacteria bacterium]
MTMPWRLAPAAVATALLVIPARVFAQATPPDPRADLQAVQSALVGAVAKVSRSGTSLILGGDSCRAYHLKGLGAVFILAPRALPQEDRVFVMRGRAQTGVSRLRQEQRRLEREAQSLAQQGRSDEAELREQEVKTMEEQAEALQRQTERERQKAEHDLDEFTQEIQIRLGPPPAPSPPSGPLPPPLPPPWRFWFESEGPEDTRGPGQVILDVRAAVTSALEGQGPSLRIVRPEESLVVAVDFVPGSPFVIAHPLRTLVVRVRKKELDDRAAGKIAPEELHRRIEYVEY